MTGRAARIAALALALALSACSDEPTLLDEPSAAFPDDLASVGIYPDVSDLAAVDPRAVAYAPAHELWSNGASKHRFAVLPAGAPVTATDPELYEFPMGTIFVKTFTYPVEGGGERPIETRLLRLGADGWEYAVYRFADDGRSAHRAALRVAEAVPVSAFGESFEHHVPSERQCRQCHEATSRRVLGWSDRSLAANGELPRLEGLGALSTAGRPVVGIEHADADTRDVLRYAWANCTHCHDGSGGPNAAFDLRPEVFLENTIDRPTESEAAMEGIRIVPGDPDTSIIYLALARSSDASAMPPVGVDRRDEDAIALFDRFIRALPPTTP